MTNRGLFGLPQGQQRGAAGVNTTVATSVFAKTVEDTSVGGFTYLTPYPNNNGTMLEFTAGLPYDIIVFGFQYSPWALSGLNNITTSVAVRLGTGPAGSETVRFVGNMNIGGAVQWSAITDPYGVYVPAGTRIAVALYFNASSGAPGILQMNWAKAKTVYPQATMEVVGSGGVNTNGTSWTQIAASPPVASGCWVVGHILQVSSASSTAQTAIQYGLGASGSEVPATAYRDLPTSNGTTSGNAPNVWFPPFWWPPGTRLAMRHNNATNSQGYVIWRSTLQ